MSEQKPPLPPFDREAAVKKIKAAITQLKAERDSALSSGDRIAYKKALRGIHHRKGELRRHTI